MVEAREFFIGDDHICYIDTNNTLWGSGRLFSGIVNTWHEIDTGVKSYSANLFHAIYVKMDGSVWGCGSNVMGRLGQDLSLSTDFQLLSGPWSGKGHIPIAVSVGVDHSMLLTNTGVLYGTGSNVQGQLGLYASKVRTWAEVPFRYEIRDVYTGPHHTFIVTDDSTLYAAGSNTYGQLGTGPDPNQHGFKLLALDINKVATCSTHTLILSDSGKVYVTGQKEGHGHTSDCNAFTAAYDKYFVIDIGVSEPSEGKRATACLLTSSQQYLEITYPSTSGFTPTSVGNTATKKIWSGSCGYVLETKHWTDNPAYLGISFDQYGQLGLGVSMSIFSRIVEEPLLLGPYLDILKQAFPDLPQICRGVENDNFRIYYIPNYEKDGHVLISNNKQAPKSNHFMIYSPLSAAGYCMLLRGGMTND